MWGAWTGAIRQESEIKVTQIRKKGSQIIPVCKWYDILYIRDLKTSNWNPPEKNQQFQQSGQIQNQCTKTEAFLHTNNKHAIKRSWKHFNLQ